MSLRLTVALCLTLAPSIGAQSWEFNANIGLSRPQSGELSFWYPSQFGDTVYRTYKFKEGAVYGARLDYLSRGILGASLGGSMTVAERPHQDQLPDLQCGDCRSTIYSTSLLITARASVLPNLHLSTGLGGELLHLTGSAYGPTESLLPKVVVVRDRRPIGALASVGAVLLLTQRQRARVDLQYRYFRINYEWEPEDWPDYPRTKSSTSNQDFLLTLGWSYSPSW